MNDKLNPTVAVTAGLNRRPPAIGETIAPHGRFHVECHGPDGRLKWCETFDNTVVNAGKNYYLDAAYSGGTAITSWFLGLTDGTPTVAAGDTMGSHAGWVEVTAYDEANRQAWTEAGPSSQVITNAASPAVFTISANGTVVGGAFLTSNNTKGGTTGTLNSAGAFSTGDKTADDNDTLTVTYQITG